MANRLLVLQLKQREPDLGVCNIAARVGVNESTVRSILKKFGTADISLGSPKAAKGAGRPKEVTERWLRCVFINNL